MRLEVNTDKELVEILSAIVADSAYSKIITRTKADGSQKSPVELSWDCSIQEQLGLVPLVLTPTISKAYVAVFSYKSKYTGLISTTLVNH